MLLTGLLPVQFLSMQGRRQRCWQHHQQAFLSRITKNSVHVQALLVSRHPCMWALVGPRTTSMKYMLNVFCQYLCGRRCQHVPSKSSLNQASIALVSIADHIALKIIPILVAAGRAHDKGVRLALIIDFLGWCDDIRDSGTRLMLPVASAINVAAAFPCGKCVAAGGDFQHGLGFAARLGITAVPVAVGGAH